MFWSYLEATATARVLCCMLLWANVLPCLLWREAVEFLQVEAWCGASSDFVEIYWESKYAQNPMIHESLYLYVILYDACLYIDISYHTYLYVFAVFYTIDAARGVIFAMVNDEHIWLAYNIYIYNIIYHTISSYLIYIYLYIYITYIYYIYIISIYINISYIYTYIVYDVYIYMYIIYIYHIYIYIIYIYMYIIYIYHIYMCMIIRIIHTGTRTHPIN